MIRFDKIKTMKPVKCNKDCRKCNKYDSARIDDKGYLFGYECLKYNETIDLKDVAREKLFLIPD